MRTFPIAIPAPARTVPTKSAAGAVTTRSAIPAVISRREPAIAVSVPSRRAATGASDAKTPRQRTGSVVRTPASTPDRPNASRRSPSSGEIPVMAARRLIVSSTRPTSDQAVRARGTGVVAGVFMSPSPCARGRVEPDGGGVPAQGLVTLVIVDGTR
ncbi:hypothetical protein [Actinomadura physcomitrii]|uniref:hypothetical protein n=1 Tax=Actinomadura physcomitrii TaxID=2650748 RepID=UPI001F2107BA|nr:hypothetical protein [Actinomadura physcomitrii]